MFGVLAAPYEWGTAAGYKNGHYYLRSHFDTFKVSHGMYVVMRVLGVLQIIGVFSFMAYFSLLGLSRRQRTRRKRA